jgi:hypothetical protein
MGSFRASVNVTHFAALCSLLIWTSGEASEHSQPKNE